MGIAVAVLLPIALMPAAAGSIQYSVSVDTSSLNGTSGFLDFQFNPGNASTQAATAQMLSFSGGTLAGSAADAGNVSGTLPGTLTFMNSAALNESYQGFTFGSSYSFFLLISGPAIDAPDGTSTAGSTFGLGVYDAGGNPILTDQGLASGFAGQVDITLAGATTSTAFPNAGGGPSVVTFSQPLLIPEPATLLLLGLGLAALAGIQSRRLR
jgi:hypothetical protein